MLCLADDCAHAVYVGGIPLARFATAEAERRALASCQASKALRQRLFSWPRFRRLLPMLACANQLRLRNIVDSRFKGDRGSLLPALYAACAEQRVTFLVDDRVKTARGDGFVTRRVGWETPAGSFLVLQGSGGQIMVPSPELHLLLRAQRLPVPDLALLVGEYCGTFWTRPDLKRGLSCTEGAVTSRGQILGFLEKVPSRVRGRRELREAVSLALDGANSPRENGLGILLTFRGEAEGFGLPRPLMNHPVTVPLEARRLVGGAESLRPDFLWPDEQVAAEYDSDLDHDDKPARRRDAARVAALEQAGLAVIQVRSEDVGTDAALEALARRIARALRREDLVWAPVGGWLPTRRARWASYRCVL